MEIEYSLAKDDFLTYQLFTASQSQSVRKRRLLYRFIGPLIYVALGFILSVQGDYISLVVFSVIALVWLLFYPLYSRWRYKSHYSKYIEEHYSKVLGKKGSVKLEDEHLAMSNNGVEAKVAFTDIDSLIELEGHFLLGISTGNTCIVPKREVEQELLSSFIADVERLTEVERVDMSSWRWR